MTTNESRALAARYWSARVRGRRLTVEARRAGVSPATLYRHALLWPEHIERLERSTTLRPWERANLNALMQESK